MFLYIMNPEEHCVNLQWRRTLCNLRWRQEPVSPGSLGLPPTRLIFCSFPFWFQIKELNRRMTLVEGILNHLERTVISPSEQVQGFFTTIHCGSLIHLRQCNHQLLLIHLC